MKVNRSTVVHKRGEQLQSVLEKPLSHPCFDRKEAFMAIIRPYILGCLKGLKDSTMDSNGHKLRNLQCGLNTRYISNMATEVPG